MQDSGNNISAILAGYLNGFSNNIVNLDKSGRLSP
jgi:hypothetical protein